MNIALVEVKFYDENISYIDIGKSPEWLEIILNERGDKDARESKPKTTNTENQEISNILEKVRKWLVELEDCVHSLKPLEKKVWKKEGYSPRIRFYDRITGKVLVSLIPQNKKINIYLNFRNPQQVSSGLKNLLDNYGIYYSEKDHGVGKGNWFSSIENKFSLQKIKNFFQEYKEKFSEN